MKRVIVGAAVVVGLSFGVGCQRSATDVEVRGDEQEVGTGGGGWSEEGVEKSGRPAVLELNDSSSVDSEGPNYNLGDREATGAGMARPRNDPQVNQPYERETQPD